MDLYMQVTSSKSKSQTYFSNYCLNWKISLPDHRLPHHIDHQKSELNNCCTIMFVKCYQTVFWSGQRRTDFKQYQTLTNSICGCFLFDARLETGLVKHLRFLSKKWVGNIPPPTRASSDEDWWGKNSITQLYINTICSVAAIFFRFELQL